MADLPFNIPNPYPYTFTQIIDADHMTVQRIAAKIRRLLATVPSSHAQYRSTQPITSPSVSAILNTLTPLLQEATWRLIRHDFSEDIVMRPCFTTILGQEGTSMSNHDRDDHARGRAQLLDIISKLSELESDLSIAPSASHRQSIDEPKGSHPSNGADSSLHHRQQQQQPDQHLIRLQDLATAIITTFDDLSTHMDIESGSFLPHFESLIDKATSTRLAREYAATLFVTPSLLHLTSSTTDSISVPAQPQSPAFAGGVASFVNTDLASMRKIYEAAMGGASRSQVVAAYLEKEIEQEVERLQVGKWDPKRMVRARKASFGTGVGVNGKADAGEDKDVRKGKL